MLGLTTSGAKPLTDTEFEALYTRALKCQETGDYPAYSKLLEEAYEAGAPHEALSMIGALAESVLHAAGAHGPA